MKIVLILIAGVLLLLAINGIVSVVLRENPKVAIQQEFLQSQDQPLDVSDEQQEVEPLSPVLRQPSGRVAPVKEKALRSEILSF